MDFDVVIVGAGAAGLMCAIEAGGRGKRVLLLDKAKKPAEKIRISGGGRCNFTNLHTTPANYLSSNPHFCKSALGRYQPADFIALVEKHAIAYHEKTLGQLFCDGSSKQIIQMLLDECADVGVIIQLETELSHLDKTDDGSFALTTNHGESLSCTSLVIASGGPSIPKMGASGWGYEVAKQFGLNIITPRVGLVPFTLQTPLVELAGVSTEAIVRCNKAAFREGLLFTHRGLSGPAILQLSSYWNEGDEICVNFLPDKNLLAELKAARSNHGKQDVATFLAQQIPKKLALFLCQVSASSGTLAECNNAALEQLASHTQNWQIKPNGTEGYRTAEVTLGGVDTSELSSKTFEAKKVSGLHFIGEVVDVTGWLGGYNFQWAWASGYACGAAV